MATSALPSSPPGRFRPFPSTRERPHPGEILLVGERYEEAIPFLEQQYHEDENGPRAFEVLSNLGICYRIAGRLIDSNKAYALAIMKEPNSGIIWANAALTMTDMGEHDAAFLSAGNAYNLARGKNNKDVDFVYTLALLREGRWTEAWKIWDGCRPKFSIRDTLPPDDGDMKEWRGIDDPIPSGSRVLVIGEWGFGDAFINLRYFGLLKEMGADITYLSWKRQRTLFEAHPWVDRVHAYVKPDGSEEPTKLHTTDYDYYTCLMDLPARFGSVPSTVPYVEGYISKDVYHKTLPPTRKRRIGLCWQAEESAYSHRFRSFRDDQIGEFESVDAEWYSLQVGQALPWMKPHNPESWTDTAQLLSQLDLVITVDTAVAHLAGAMNVPTWLLLPAGSAWQWLRDRDTSVWYDSMRLFRSDAADDFLDLPAKVARELR